MTSEFDLYISDKYATRDNPKPTYHSIYPSSYVWLSKVIKTSVNEFKYKMESGDDGVMECLEYGLLLLKTVGGGEMEYDNKIRCTVNGGDNTPNQFNGLFIHFKYITDTHEIKMEVVKELDNRAGEKAVRLENNIEVSYKIIEKSYNGSASYRANEIQYPMDGIGVVNYGVMGMGMMMVMCSIMKYYPSC